LSLQQSTDLFGRPLAQCNAGRRRDFNSSHSRCIAPYRWIGSHRCTRSAEDRFG
jgi:hypothetical protein